MSEARPILRQQGTSRISSDRRHERDYTTRLLHLIGKILFFALLILFAVIFLLPFLWMFSTSLKKIGAVFTVPIEWIPEKPQWNNYVEIFKMLPFGRFLLNSAIVTILATAGNVLSSLVVGYSLARLRWPGRELIFALLLGTMMLPGVVTLIPLFVMFFKVGWIDTYYPLIVPSWFGNAFYIFMLRQFMRGLPIEFDEAARIDGASSLRILTRIVMPLCKPAISAVIIFAGMAHYNDFVGPLLYLSQNEKFTVPLGLYMFQGQHVTLWHLVMAASTVAVAPLLLLFFAGQRYFVQGISFSGLTGR